jgi:hypothetical protein
LPIWTFHGTSPEQVNGIRALVPHDTIRNRPTEAPQIPGESGGHLNFPLAEFPILYATNLAGYTQRSIAD